MLKTALYPRHRTLVLLVALVILALVARLLPGPRTIDDAFITFRYSRNLVEGQGFVYNPGERVLGTTTPLFTLLMAAVSLLTGQQDYQWYAIGVSAVADSATVVLLFLLVRRLTQNEWAGALLGGLWAISPMSVTFAVGGMETSVNILWMVSAAWCFVNGRDGWLGVFAALGLLTRVDSLIWVGLLWLFQFIERLATTTGRPLAARFPWRTWLACAVVLSPWLVFSLSYFGSPVPRSLAAKGLAYMMPPGSALQRLIQFYATPFFEFDAFGPMGAIAGLVVYTALNGIGMLFAARRLPRLLPFLFYPWLYLAVFSVANPLIFRWYLAPPMPALMLGVLAGGWALIESLHKATENGWVPRVALGALTVMWGGLSLNAWELHPDHGLDRPAPVMAWNKVELLYQDMAMQLVEEYGVTPDMEVAAGDIGTIGYFTRARILDTVGLVTPQVEHYYPISPDLIVPGQNYAIPPQLIADTRPPYLVVMEAAVRLGVERDPTFQADYLLLREIPTDFYGTGMRLYRRVHQ